MKTKEFKRYAAKRLGIDVKDIEIEALQEAVKMRDNTLIKVRNLLHSSAIDIILRHAHYRPNYHYPICDIDCMNELVELILKIKEDISDDS